MTSICDNCKNQSTPRIRRGMHKLAHLHTKSTTEKAKEMLREGSLRPYDGREPHNLASLIANGVLKDLQSRLGLDEKLAVLEDDVQYELTNTMTEIVALGMSLPTFQFDMSVWLSVGASSAKQAYLDNLQLLTKNVDAYFSTLAMHGSNHAETQAAYESLQHMNSEAKKIVSAPTIPTIPYGAGIDLDLEFKKK